MKYRPQICAHVDIRTLLSMTRHAALQVTNYTRTAMASGRSIRFCCKVHRRLMHGNTIQHSSEKPRAQNSKLKMSKLNTRRDNREILMHFTYT